MGLGFRREVSAAGAQLATCPLAAVGPGVAGGAAEGVVWTGPASRPWTAGAGTIAGTTRERADAGAAVDSVLPLGPLTSTWTGAGVAELGAVESAARRSAPPSRATGAAAGVFPAITLGAAHGGLETSVPSAGSPYPAMRAATDGLFHPSLSGRAILK